MEKGEMEEHEALILFIENNSMEVFKRQRVSLPSFGMPSTRFSE